MRRRVLPGVLAAAALAAAVPAADAAVTTHSDGAGRTITVDTRSGGASPATYAAILRDSVHGDEIERVVVRVVARGRIASLCGSGEATACYSGNGRRGTMIVPAGTRSSVEHTVLHEYGHHVDAAIGGSAQEPNGTPRWWSARRMGTRLAAGEVAGDYRLGWTRSIGEIFAEDYVQLHLRGRSAIGWLDAPSTGVLNAIRRDVTGRASAGGTTSGGRSLSRTWRQNGLLGAGERATIPFGTLGSGRRVIAVIRVRGGRVDALLRCKGRALARASGDDAGVARISRKNLPRGSCTITVANTGDAPVQIGSTLTLKRPAR